MKKELLYTVLVLLSTTLFFFSCRKAVINERKTLDVSDANQLYDAVNDSANAGAVIVLAAGTYTLISKQPNAGRLELQKDMEIVGQEGHPDLVIIDESALPPASFTIPQSFRSGGIRMGRGSNFIRWLTVLGNPSTNALSAIDTDLAWQDVIHIGIAHLIVKGSQNGIDIRNPGFAGVNRVIEAEIENNEFLENTVALGKGLFIQNVNGATGSVIRANLKGNCSHGNRLGLASFNTATSSARITINSTNDRLEDNGIGCWLSAGATSSATDIAKGNTLNFEAHGTSIRNNRRKNNTEGTPAGGLYAAAGLSAINANSTSDNQLTIVLSRSPLSGNESADINAFGAHSFTSDLAGTNNITQIYLDDYSKNGTAVITASLPSEPRGTNVVKIFK